MLSVLVVDHISADQQAVLKALSQRGFSCQTASSADEADALLSETAFDTVVVYQRTAGDRLDEFVGSASGRLPRSTIIAVQTEYDGPMECELFDLGADDVVTLEYSPDMLAMRAALRTENRGRMASR